MSGTLERSQAYERPYTYNGAAIAPGISWLMAQPAVQMRAELGLSARRYAALDPFFGERRTDNKIRVDLGAKSKQWRLFSYRPALSVGIERNRSSIEFYAYRKVNFSVALE